MRAIHLGSEPLTRLLADVALDPDLIALIDVPALERSSLAKFDSATVSAVEALCRVSVQVALLAPRDPVVLERIHRALPLAWCFDDAERPDALVRVRERAPGRPLLAISDDPALLTGLFIRDRGVALGCHDTRTLGNVVRTGDLNLRAALWWLVYVRTDAGLGA
jgi:hypothetical protein